MPGDRRESKIGFKFDPDHKAVARLTPAAVPVAAPEAVSDREIFLSYGFAYEPTQVYSGLKTIKQERETEGDYEVETIRFANGKFIRIPTSLGEGVISHLGICYDAGSLVLNNDGMITDFALADGVSGSTNGKAAAERAVYFGALAVRSGQVEWNASGMQSMLRQVEDKMQDFDLEKTRLKWAETVHKDPTMNYWAKKNLIERTGYVESDGKLIRHDTEQSKEYGIGSTTLIIGHLKGSTLHMVYAADGGYVVVNSSHVKAYGGEHEQTPPQLNLKPGRRVPDDDIKYVKLELSPGDVVMVFTDGLYYRNGEPEEIAIKVMDLLKRGQNLDQIMKALLENSKGADDNSLLAFTFKG